MTGSNATYATMIVAAAALAFGAPVAAAGNHAQAMGGARASAKPNVNRPHSGGPKPGGQFQGAGGQGNHAGAQGNRPGRGGNNVVAGNTVVVGQPNRGGHNNGYYHNGNYYDGRDWDDDDNDFLEFVGKTAAITAGVSVVSAVIGSTVKDRPSGCQEVNSGGRILLYCNGTYYEPMGSGQSGYTVVAPPR